MRYSVESKGNIHVIIENGYKNVGVVIGSKQKAFKRIKKLKESGYEGVKQETNVVLYSTEFNCFLDSSNKGMH